MLNENTKKPMAYTCDTFHDPSVSCNKL